MTFPVYRLNTYPVIHMGFFHALVNTLALTPLLERFEAEHGTLTALALFLGRTYGLSMKCDRDSDLGFLLSAFDVSGWIVYPD